MTIKRLTPVRMDGMVKARHSARKNMQTDPTSRKLRLLMNQLHR